MSVRSVFPVRVRGGSEPHGATSPRPTTAARSHNTSATWTTMLQSPNRRPRLLLRLSIAIFITAHKTFSATPEPPQGYYFKHHGIYYFSYRFFAYTQDNTGSWVYHYDPKHCSVYNLSLLITLFPSRQKRHKIIPTLSTAHFKHFIIFHITFSPTFRTPLDHEFTITVPTITIYTILYKTNLVWDTTRSWAFITLL